MSQNASSATDTANSGKSISFWDPEGTLKKLINDVAHDIGVKPSELVYEIVAENIHNYADYSELPDYKRRWIRQKQQEIEEQYIRDLANAQQKRNTFLHYISSQIHRQITRGADKEEIQAWTKEQKLLFENRELLERYQHVYDEPGLYFSAYNKWVRNNQQGGATKFIAPNKDHEEGDGPYDR